MSVALMSEISPSVFRDVMSRLRAKSISGRGMQEPRER